MHNLSFFHRLDVVGLVLFQTFKLKSCLANMKQKCRSYKKKFDWTPEWPS